MPLDLPKFDTGGILRWSKHRITVLKMPFDLPLNLQFSGVGVGGDGGTHSITALNKI